MKKQSKVNYYFKHAINLYSTNIRVNKSLLEANSFLHQTKNHFFFNEIEYLIKNVKGRQKYKPELVY